MIAAVGDLRDRKPTGEWFDVMYDFGSPETFGAYRRDRAAAWLAVIEAAKDYMEPDGVVRMRNRTFCMVACR